MIRSAIIVDTNVVVAGLLDRPVASPEALVLEGMSGAAFPFVLSEALLAEYREVLARPALRKRHGLSDQALESLFEAMAQHAIALTPVPTPPATRAPDPGDQMLWELLAARADLLLVTADKLLLRDRGMRGRVISAQAFVAAEV